MIAGCTVHCKGRDPLNKVQGITAPIIYIWENVWHFLLKLHDFFFSRCILMLIDLLQYPNFANIEYEAHSMFQVSIITQIPIEILSSQ